MSIVVAQLGARMHYAVPCLLHRAGRLDHFFTDLCASKGWPRWCSRLPAGLASDGLRRLGGRDPQGVPGERITAFNVLGLRYARMRRRARSPEELTQSFLWAGRAFCRRIVSRGLGEARSVYAFNSAALELFEAAKARGRRTVLEQTIAPRRVEHTLLQEEHERFPDWHCAADESDVLDRYCAREEAEWRLADLILCGSDFVRDGIAQCGGPVERCVVVPYGVDRSLFLPPRPNRSGKLRVLVVGAVGLRKGSPYVLAAARSLTGKAVFRMVGGIEASPHAARRLGEAVELTGGIPNTKMAAQFAWADVFLLPSLCEGSATAVYEALAASLPVICTPNTGSVVRDGIDGIIVPPRDSMAIVAAVTRLAEDPTLRRHMAQNARARAAAFDLEAYGRSLLAALDGDAARAVS